MNPLTPAEIAARDLILYEVDDCCCLACGKRADDLDDSEGSLSPAEDADWTIRSEVVHDPNERCGSYLVAIIVCPACHTEPCSVCDGDALPLFGGVCAPCWRDSVEDGTHTIDQVPPAVRPLCRPVDAAPARAFGPARFLPPVSGKGGAA